MASGPARRVPQILALLSIALFLPAAESARLLADPPAGGTMQEVAVLETPLGQIVWRFFPDEAPEHTAYVKKLIRSGFYDGTTFHRVIPHFVIQGGDPNSKNADRSDDGYGEADRRLKAEFSHKLHYRPGTVGMARDADPDSGSCQFFIALESIPRLDGNYTIFGEVIEGLDVARKIADLPRDLEDNPLDRVPITATIEKRALPDAIASLAPGESGELVTGPGHRPEYFDPGDVTWAAPKRISGELAEPRRAHGRLELTVDTDGRVIDVRFPKVLTAGAADLRDRALTWRFDPVLDEGQPRLVRFEIDSDGTNVGPTTGGGAPVEAGRDVPEPVAAVRVDLDPGEKAPESPTKLRLTIDGSGAVTDAAVQKGCGRESLDKKAVEAAMKMLFTPVRKGTLPDGSPRTFAVHLNVEARFMEAAPESH